MLANNKSGTSTRCNFRGEKSILAHSIRNEERRSQRQRDEKREIEKETPIHDLILQVPLFSPNDTVPVLHRHHNPHSQKFNHLSRPENHFLYDNLRESPSFFFVCLLFHRQCALFILTSSAILRIRRFAVLFLRSRLLTPPPPPSSSASLFPPHFFCFDVFRGVDDGPRMKYICRVTTYTAFNRQRIQDALEMHFGVRFLPARKRSRRALRSVPGSRLFCLLFYCECGCVCVFT